MGLDKALVGVVGASAALFVIFSVLTIIIGCYCLRRARRRSRQKLEEKLIREQQERESHHDNLGYAEPQEHHSDENVNHTQTVGSLAKSDGPSIKMSNYRPKILEDATIGPGTTSSKGGSQHEGSRRGISTIYVNDKKEASTHKNKEAELNYNQTNGFVVKGYLQTHLGRRAEDGYLLQRGSWGVADASSLYTHTMVPAGHEGDQHNTVSRHELPRDSTTGHRQVIKQRVEARPDGKLVVVSGPQYLTGGAPSDNMVDVRQTMSRAEKDNEVSNKKEIPTNVLSSHIGPHSTYPGFEQETTQLEHQGDSIHGPVSLQQTNIYRADMDGNPTVDNRDFNPAYSNDTGSQRQDRWVKFATDGSHGLSFGAEDEAEADAGYSGADAGDHVYTQVTRTSKPENYKAIKREHSAHPSVSGWVQESQTVSTSS